MLILDFVNFQMNNLKVEREKHLLQGCHSFFQIFSRFLKVHILGLFLVLS